MDNKDHYKTLGIEHTATEDEIRRAFRDLARKHHPDRNPNDTEAESRFKQINEAYETLSDADKRAKYDQQSYQYAGGAGYGYDSQGNPDIFSGFSNIFGRQRDSHVNRQPIRGRDLEQSIDISLEEAYHGTERVLTRGNNKRRTIRIPQGARDGTRIRVQGEGDAGFAGGSAGDLYLIVALKNHTTYERREDDLYTDLKIPLYTAVLGGEAVVPTLGGEVKVRIPPGTQSGQTIRISGKGMPILRQEGQAGNLYAKILIQIPTHLTGQELAAFEELASLRANE
jgi:curved DNA-binding protein